MCDTKDLYITGRFCLFVCNVLAYSCPALYRFVFMVFNGSRLALYGSRLVFHGFVGVFIDFMVPGWFFMGPGCFSWFWVGFQDFS